MWFTFRSGSKTFDNTTRRHEAQVTTTRNPATPPPNSKPDPKEQQQTRSSGLAHPHAILLSQYQTQRSPCRCIFSIAKQQESLLIVPAANSQSETTPSGKNLVRSLFGRSTIFSQRTQIPRHHGWQRSPYYPARRRMGKRNQRKG